MNTPQAIIFDLNGTMIDDMHFHLEEWYNVIVNHLGANLTLQQVKAQMYGSNFELFERVFGQGRYTPEEIETIAMMKERQYQERYRPHLRLIEGLPAFLERIAQHHIKLGIASAAPPFNIDFVLDNLNIRSQFGTVVSAADVKKSKPDPEPFLKAAQNLGVAPEHCLVFEDAPKGIEAALRAGMNAVAITTIHNESEFSQYPDVLFFIKDYTDPRLATLIQ